MNKDVKTYPVEICDELIDICGFCGCFNSQPVVHGLHKELLRIHGNQILSEEYEKSKTPIMERHYKMLEDENVVYAYILDAAGFTEHGGSVGWAWLDIRGKIWLDKLNKSLETKGVQQ